MVKQHPNWLKIGLQAGFGPNFTVEFVPVFQKKFGQAYCINEGKEQISISKPSLRFRYVTPSGKSNSLPYSYSKIATRSGTSNFSFRFFSILDLAITKSIHGTQSVCLTSLCFRCLRISEQIYSLGTVCRQAMLLACKYQRPVSLISTARLTA